jgi:calcineurin-like phosphoesterase family protein
VAVYIEKIILNEAGILNVMPKDFFFDKIYRSAKGVHWNEKTCYLYHNPLQEWDTLQRYKQIVLAVKDEYGVTLRIDSETIYDNIDAELRIKIEMEF